MTDDEHLKKILDKCAANLNLCETNKAYDFHTSEDAKAGWLTTIATIEECRHLIGSDENNKNWSESEWVAQGVIARIIESWPKELL